LQIHATPETRYCQLVGDHPCTQTSHPQRLQVTDPARANKSEVSRAAVSKDFNELKGTIFDFNQAMNAIVNRIDALENELSPK